MACHSTVIGKLTQKTLHRTIAELHIASFTLGSFIKPDTTHMAQCAHTWMTFSVCVDAPGKPWMVPTQKKQEASIDSLKPQCGAGTIYDNGWTTEAGENSASACSDS